MTQGDWRHWLDHLAAIDDDLALEAARRPQSHGPTPTAPCLVRDASGRHGFSATLDASFAHDDVPAVLIDWFQARAYARSAATRSALAWRLPNELELEKAGRSVDGRSYVWGQFAEAARAAVVGSRPGPPVISKVHEHPDDESVYGVRGLCGNVRVWCGNTWSRGGPSAGADRVAHVESDLPEDGHLAVRGGSWQSVVRAARLASRFGDRPHRRYRALGIRLAAPWPPGAQG